MTSPAVKHETAINLNDDSALLCPCCGNEYLHHGAIAVFSRNEDAETTTVTEVTDGGIESARKPSRQVSNPSARRGGIAITFGCEGCGEQWELTFAQHKGITYCGWRFVGFDYDRA